MSKAFENSFTGAWKLFVILRLFYGSKAEYYKHITIFNFHRILTIVERKLNSSIEATFFLLTRFDLKLKIKKDSLIIGSSGLKGLKWFLTIIASH